MRTCDRRWTEPRSHSIHWPFPLADHRVPVSPSIVFRGTLPSLSLAVTPTTASLAGMSSPLVVRTLRLRCQYDAIRSRERPEPLRTEVKSTEQTEHIRRST